jgi:hypothetical protein
MRGFKDVFALFITIGKGQLVQIILQFLSPLNGDPKSLLLPDLLHFLHNRVRSQIPVQLEV